MCPHCSMLSHVPDDPKPTSFSVSKPSSDSVIVYSTRYWGSHFQSLRQSVAGADSLAWATSSAIAGSVWRRW